jgi:hypothetical protein
MAVSSADYFDCASSRQLQCLHPAAAIKGIAGAKVYRSFERNNRRVRYTRNADHLGWEHGQQLVAE